MYLIFNYKILCLPKTGVIRARNLRSLSSDFLQLRVDVILAYQHINVANRLTDHCPIYTAQFTKDKLKNWAVISL